MADSEPRKPIARCLGEAVGHLVQAVRAPVPTERVLVERRSEVREHQGLRFRRTVIDEIEAPSDHADSTPPRHANDS
ncbi:MAG: hypothetical protein ACO3Y3_06925 [Phycisphaerales bacterium]|jgi:hypothetical protein